MNLIDTVSITLDDVVGFTREKDRVRLFPGYYEAFCLIIPALGATIIVIDMLFFKLLTGGTEEAQINRFITSLFFFNSIHVYFTFAYLLTIPEFKEWISATTNGKPWQFWFEIAGVITITGLLAAIAYFNVPIDNYTLPLFAVIFILIIPYHHAIKQVFGVSMLYNAEINKRYTLTDEERQRARTCTQYERWAFTAFMTFFFSSFLLGSVGSALQLNSTTLRYTSYLLYVFATLSVIFILVNCLRYPYARKSNKLLFLLRLLHYPLLPFNLLADPTLRACHGTEYLCVTGAIAKNSSMTKALKKQFISISVLLILIGIVFLLCRSNDGLVSFLYQGGYSEVPAFVKILAFSSIVLTYTHYYLDRRLFRFRNPDNRKYLLPLLHS